MRHDLLKSHLQASPLRAKVREGCGKGPGVYRFFAQGELVYVGRSKQLRTRLLSYFRADEGSKASIIATAADHLEWTETPSEFECHLTELRLIKEQRPRYNRALKDDRDYTFVRVGPGPAPRLLLSRKPTPYGPFRSPGRVQEALRRLSDLLQLRTSPDTIPMFDPAQTELFSVERRPRCLRGQIGLCLAPCAGRVDFGDYQARLASAKRFLLGREQHLLEDLRARMLEASGKLEFERAGVYRDRLSRLEILSRALSSLRESLERLTFVYAVPGEKGEDLLYFLRGGRVVGRAPRPRGERQVAAALELSQALLEKVTPPISGDEMDEIKVVASWFRARPVELTRTRSAADFQSDPRRWPEAGAVPARRRRIELPVIGPEPALWSA